MAISSVPLPHTSGLDSNHQAIEIDLCGQQEPLRRETEVFIKQVFRKAYGARIDHFLPYLLSMRQNGGLLAALGICPAREGELFLETYLDMPIENRLAEHFKRPIDRNSIVEVGNLASAHGGGARFLFTALSAYLSGAGYQWAVFTATPQVRNSFAKLGVELIPLAHADKQRLGKQQERWGSYYDQQPVVVVGDVAKGAKKILSLIETQLLFPHAQQLWADALYAGRHGHLWQPPRILAGQWPEWALEDDYNFTA